jgi:hypothetical protein
MSSRPTPPRPVHKDLVVFLAVLTAGCVLILVGRVGPQDLAGYTAALSGLFAAWQHRPPTRRIPPPPGTDPRGGTDE